MDTTYISKCAIVDTTKQCAWPECSDTWCAMERKNRMTTDNEYTPIGSKASNSECKQGLHLREKNTFSPDINISVYIPSEAEIEAAAMAIRSTVENDAVLYRGIHNEPRINAQGWAKDIMIDCVVVAKAALIAAHKAKEVEG